jgi:AAA family ATP:ADP antiporter
MSQTISHEFGTLRSFLWPIYRHECRKIVPMIVMCFLICFNYSILRNMKDAVVVTASGAAVIPFIKVWALLPMAVLLTYIFTKLSNRYSQERVVYIMISAFLFFFALFGFVLYPLRDVLHPTEFAKSLEQTLPTGLSGFVAMFSNWTFTGFYVMAELWSSIIYSVLFYGFANEITKITEARRFYAVLSVASNLAAILAGQSANYFSHGGFLAFKFPFGETEWEQTMSALLLIIITSGMVVMAAFWWMNRNVLNGADFEELHKNKKQMGLKKSLSIRESFNYLSSSKYLVCIATIVVGYNLVINLVEVIWKDQLVKLYSDPTVYNCYMNNLTSMVGVISAIISFFMASIISRMGWTFTALITPAILLITGIGFFTFLIFQEYFSWGMLVHLGATPLALVVFFGGAQNCLSKAAKYSVFDTTKEMAFIPLDHELKLKGKAAIDGVGSRLGKSGGSLIHQGLIVFFGSLSHSAPYVAVILLIAIFFWIAATKALGREFNDLVAADQPQLVSS